MSTVAAASGVLTTLQSAVAATTAASVVVAPPPSFNRHLVIIVGSSGISAGKVKVQAAHADDYAGTWALVGTEQTLIASTALIVSFTGAYPFVRAVVSTTVEGGTVTAYYYGAP
jgi:hypothetical protein